MNVSVYNRMTNAEKEVANTLTELGIKWSFEKPMFVWDENNRPWVWEPDFYLIHFGIYVEVCGSDKYDYEYRKNIFDKNDYLVIFLHIYKKKVKWKQHLLRYLYVFMKYRNYKMNKIFRKHQ